MRITALAIQSFSSTTARVEFARWSDDGDGAAGGDEAAGLAGRSIGTIERSSTVSGSSALGEEDVGPCRWRGRSDGRWNSPRRPRARAGRRRRPRIVGRLAAAGGPGRSTRRLARAPRSCRRAGPAASRSPAPRRGPPAWPDESGSSDRRRRPAPPATAPATSSSARTTSIPRSRTAASRPATTSSGPRSAGHDPEVELGAQQPAHLERLVQYGPDPDRYRPRPRRRRERSRRPRSVSRSLSPGNSRLHGPRKPRIGS